MTPDQVDLLVGYSMLAIALATLTLTCFIIFAFVRQAVKSYLEKRRTQ